MKVYTESTEYRLKHIESKTKLRKTIIYYQTINRIWKIFYNFLFP